MSITETILAVLARMPFWALFASPLIAALFFFAKWLRRRNIKPLTKLICFVSTATILLMPLPIGMFLALVPNAYLLFGDLGYYHLVWQWVVFSLPLTAFFVTISSRKYLYGRI